MKKNTTKFISQDGKILDILDDHVRTESGNFNGVCVSACLSYLEIKPHQYKYTWSKKLGNKCALNIMRRFGWAVRSRQSTLLKNLKQ